MSFSVFFCFYLLRPFCSAKRNDFSHFGRGSPKKYFCFFFFFFFFIYIGPLAKEEMSFEEIVDGRTEGRTDNV